VADNIVAQAVTTSGATFATDQDATSLVHYPLTKLVWGALDTFNIVDTASGKPLPVQLRTPLGDSVVDDTKDAIKVVQATASDLNVTIGNSTLAVTQSGTWTVGLSAGTNNIGDVDVLTFPSTVHSEDYDTGAGTDTTLAFGIALPASGGAVAGGTSSNPIRVDPTGTTTQPVSGTVTANAGTGPWPVTDNGGSLTVDGTVTVTQATASNLNVTVGNSTLAVTQSGTWNVGLNAGTNNIGDVDIASITPVTATGTITALNGTVAIDVGGYGAVGIQLSGTWSATVTFEATVDGTNWTTLEVWPTGGSSPQTTSTSNGVFYAPCGGLNQIRARASAFSSGTIQVDMQASTASAKMLAAGGTGGTSSSFASSFPSTGTAVGFNDGTNMQAAEVVDADTGAGTEYILKINPRFTASGGSVEAGTASNPFRIDPTGTTTQPISGTVTANAGSGTFTVDSELPAAATLGDAASNPTTPTVGAANLLFNGTTWDRVRGDTTNGIDVDVTRVQGSVTVTQATASNLNVTVGAALPAGTNNIGDVDVLTQPARDRLTDNIGVALQTDVLLNDTTALTPAFSAIGTATSGDNTIVALTSGKKIRILSMCLIAAGTVNVYLKDSVTGNNIIGTSTQPMNLVANMGFVLPFNPLGWGETAAGEALVMNLSAATGVSGSITYVKL